MATKGPVKTPFADSIVSKASGAADYGTYTLAGDASGEGIELVIGVRHPCGGDLLDDMGK